MGAGRPRPSSPPGIWLRWVSSTPRRRRHGPRSPGSRAIGEQFFVFDSLGMLAGVAEARGDLEGAADAYEQLLDRRSGLWPGEPRPAVAHPARRAPRPSGRRRDRRATVRRSGRPAAMSPTIRGTALIGLAGATRRLGDAESALTMLEQAEAEFGSVGHDDGRVAVLTAWCWWAIAAGDLEAAADFADQACRVASHDDPSMRVSAQTAAAACRRNQFRFGGGPRAFRRPRPSAQRE